MVTANTAAIAHCILLEIKKLMESRPLESISELKIHDDKKYEIVNGISELCSEERYFALKYKTCPTMPLGIVSCDNEEEELFFLYALRDRLKEGKEVDWEKAQEIAEALYPQALKEVAYSYTDDGDDEFPWEGNIPYWMTDSWMTEGYNPDTLRMTINFCPRYSFSSEYLHRPTDNNWLLVKSEVNCDEECQSDIMDSLNVLDELERILVQQTVVLVGGESFADDTEENESRYAAFQYATHSAYWLLPSPENLEFLADFSKDKYYDDLGSEKYRSSEKMQFSEEFEPEAVFKQAAITWMKAVAVQLRKREEYSYSDWKKEWRKAIKVIRAI